MSELTPGLTRALAILEDEMRGLRAQDWGGGLREGVKADLLVLQDAYDRIKHVRDTE